MARPANPNADKIKAAKAELKEHASLVRKGESAAKKVAKLEERIAKLSGDEPKATKKAVKSSKVEKTDKKPGKKKLEAKSEKKSGKVVTQKTRGRPKKVVADDEDDD